MRKTLRLQPDLRFGHDKSGTKRETASVDAFLTVLYDSVAETLPDRHCSKSRCINTVNTIMDAATVES